MKRAYALLACLIVLATLLTSCATPTSQPATSQPTAPSAGQPATSQPAATQPADQGLLGQIMQQKQLIVGTSADYPPYESVDKNNNYTGLDMDVIREIGKRMGVDVKIQDMGFDSLIAAVQQRKVDVVIAAMQATAARAQTVDFSVVYHMPKDGFLVSSKATFTMSDPKDAGGKNIGVQTGTVQDTWIENNLVKTGLTKESQVFRYERVDDAARDLQNGRIDVLMIIGDAAEALAKQMGLKVALLTDKTISAGQAIAMPKGETALKAKIDGIIGDMQSDGTMQKLQDADGVP
jgi:polar amino acid transport system substrate-binding protein